MCRPHKYDSQYCVSLRWHKGVTNTPPSTPPSSTSRALPVELSVDDDAASVASSFGTCHEDSGSMDIEPDPDGI